MLYFFLHTAKTAYCRFNPNRSLGFGFMGLVGSMSTPQNICRWLLPPEHLYQSVIRLSGIRLEERQRHLPFRREQRSVSYMMLFVKMRANFLCHFFQWQLCIDAPEFTDCKTLPILLHEIELGKWLRARNIRYFS